MYVNMSELASMAAHKAQEMAINLPPPPPELTEHTERTESNEKDGSTSESSLESSSGYGSQTTFPNEEAHNEGGMSRLKQIFSAYSQCVFQFLQVQITSCMVEILA